MNLAPWVQGYIRKLPKDFEGEILIRCLNGRVEVERRDRLDEETFKRRYQAHLYLKDPGEDGVAPD